MVLTVRAGLIGEITGFADPSLFLLLVSQGRSTARPARGFELTGGICGL
jgi:hypothetical protein